MFVFLMMIMMYEVKLHKANNNTNNTKYHMLGVKSRFCGA